MPVSSDLNSPSNIPFSLSLSFNSIDSLLGVTILALISPDEIEFNLMLIRLFSLLSVIKFSSNLGFFKSHWIVLRMSSIKGPLLSSDFCQIQLSLDNICTTLPLPILSIASIGSF